MDFTIPEELDSAKNLAARILGDFTDVDQLRAVESGGSGIDRKLWQALADAGLLGVDIAQPHGGMGMGFFALAILCEEVGRTAAPLAVVPVLAGTAGTLGRASTFVVAVDVERKSLFMIRLVVMPLLSQ